MKRSSRNWKKKITRFRWKTKKKRMQERKRARKKSK
jgi:hypothetical protein